MAAGEVLFADGDATYDLFVVLAGEAPIVERLGQPGETVIASYGPSQFLGEIGLLTGQRAYLSAVAATAGRVLRVPVAQVRVVMAQEPGLSELILRTFLLRHSILTGRGSGLTLIGSRFDAGTRRLLEVLARNRLVSRWLELEGSPDAEAMLRELDVPVADLPLVVVPGGPLLRNPAAASCSTRWACPARPTPICPACATCWWWVRVRAAWRPPSTGRPREWPRAGRGHRAGRPGGNLVPDREPTGLPGGPVRRGAGGARGLAGPEVRRAHQAGVQSGVASSRTPVSTGSASTTAMRSPPSRSSSPPGRATTGCPLARLAEFEGVGVYYAATQMEAQACQAARSPSWAAATPPVRPRCS